MPKINSVTIEPGCIACHTCEGVCSQIFKVDGQSTVISDDFVDHADKIREAAKRCPVQVIAVKEDGAEATPRTHDLEGTLISTKKLAHDVFAFYVRVDHIDYKPGQFIAFQMSDAAGAFVRCYSIAGYEKGVLEFCIKLVPDGRGARWWRAQTADAKLAMMPPTGHLILRDTAQPKLLVATGTGLAPMLAMLTALAKDKSKTKRTMLMGVRSESEVFYENRLHAYPDTKVIYTLSRPSKAWQGNTGRVTDYLEQSLTPDTEVYICGNPAMVQSVVDQLKKIGHPSELVCAEEFSSPPDTAAAPKTKDSSAGWLGKLALPRPVVSAINYLFMIAGATVPFLWYYTDLDWTLWDVSWYAVFALMALRPLGDIFPQLPFLRQLLPVRQGLGVLSASVIATNAGFNYIPNLAGFAELYFNLDYWRFADRSFFAHASELAGIILLATSNRFSQRTLGAWWKRIQRLSYLYFYGAGIYLIHIGKEQALYAMLFVAMLQATAFFHKRNLLAPAAAGAAGLIVLGFWIQPFAHNKINEQAASERQIAAPAAISAADTTPPTIEFLWPTDGAVVNQAAVDVQLTLSDDSGNAWAKLQVLDAAGNARAEYNANAAGIVAGVQLEPGLNTLLVIANDNAKNIATKFIFVTR